MNTSNENSRGFENTTNSSDAFRAIGSAQGRRTSSAKSPNFERVTEQLFSSLVSGDRRGSREIVDAIYAAGIPAETIAKDIYWPLLESISAMYRKDQMTTLAHHYATRLLRMLVDQAQARFAQQAPRGQRIAMFCGPNETEELAGQLVADLLEADGYEVTFAGGGVANDEIRAELGEREAETLLIFASSAKDAPFIRELIDSVRTSGAFDNLQIVVGGGVFNRAPGLAEEIGADVSASSPRDLLEKLVAERTTRNTRWIKSTRRSRSAA